MFLERVRRERVLQRLVRAHGATLGPRGLETLGKRPVGVFRIGSAVLLSDALCRTRNACCALAISECLPRPPLFPRAHRATGLAAVLGDMERCRERLQRVSKVCLQAKDLGE